ncbi:MAG: hypothetical protein WBL93_01945, partial [Lutisporaceae bacterium]
MKAYERIIQLFLFLCALIAVFAVILISFFIVKEGWPVIQKVGFFNFILGKQWAPTQQIYGIFPMVLGSVYVTLGALILGVPIGVGCSVFLAEIAKPRIANIIRPGIELLSGI